MHRWLSRKTSAVAVALGMAGCDEIAESDSNGGATEADDGTSDDGGTSTGSGAEDDGESTSTGEASTGTSSTGEASTGTSSSGDGSESSSTGESSTSDGEASTTGEPADVRVQILGLNDFHGNLAPPSGSSGSIAGTPAGGVAHLAAHIEALRRTEPNTIVVSAGDLVGASPLVSGLFHDEPTIELMNALGLDLNAVGNHEFDEGYRELLRLQDGGCHPVDGCQLSMPFAGADFQFLAANVRDEDTEQTILPAVEVRTFDGVPIAFIGMTLEGTPEIVTREGIEGLRFDDEVETVNALVPVLRSEGIETIVVLVHEGGFGPADYDGCQGISGPVVDIAEGVDDAVDVIVSGHTHQGYNCQIDGKIVSSAASFGRLVTDIDLLIDGTTGDVISASAQNVIVTRDIVDADIEAMVGTYVEAAAPLANRSIGTLTETLSRTARGNGQSPLGAVIADAQRVAMADDQAARIAFMNPGGIRADLLYAAAEGEVVDGVVSYGEAYTVQPFTNYLVAMTVTRAELVALLEQQWQPTTTRILQVSSGFSYAFVASPGPGQSRIVTDSLRLDGEPIPEDATVRIVVNSFLAGGGDGFSVLTAGTDRVVGPVDVDAFETYLEANSPLSPPDDIRVTVQ